MDALLEPQHTRFGPVFVVGCARSGTSLTCRLLLDHLGVNFGTESQFIIRYFRRLSRYGDLRTPGNLRRLLHDISHERFFARTRRNFGFVLNVDRALQSVVEPTYAGALRAIFGQFAATKGMARWGDKTPEYNYNLPTLLDLFPTAQFVHVVRDPRAVALSQFKVGFGSKSAYEAASRWREAMNLVRSFGTRVGPDQFMEFRYEDLLADPITRLEGVARFLGIANHSAVVASKARHLCSQVRADDSDKWRALDPGDLACIEAVAAAEMAASGYGGATTGLVRIGAIRRARWRVQGLWRRLVDHRCWADDVYRLGLRARAVRIMHRPLARS